MSRNTIGVVVAAALVTMAGILTYSLVDSGKVVPGSDEELALAIETLGREARMRPLKKPEDDFEISGIRYRISDPEVSEAIRMCREARSREAIPALVQLADAPDRTLGCKPVLPDAPGWAEGVSPTPLYLVYPAAAALVSMSRASVPELMEALAEEPPSGRRARILREILVEIVGHEGASELVSARISEAEDEVAEVRLAAHLAKLPKACPNPVFGEPSEGE